MPWCSTEHLDEFMQIYNVRQSENTEQKCMTYTLLDHYVHEEK